MMSGMFEPFVCDDCKREYPHRGAATVYVLDDFQTVKLKCHECSTKHHPSKQVAWVVVHYHKKWGLVYWTGFDDDGGKYFSRESLDALRFARKQDAEKLVHDLKIKEVKIEEHCWVT